MEYSGIDKNSTAFEQGNDLDEILVVVDLYIESNLVRNPEYQPL